jgi:hypothetical protein
MAASRALRQMKLCMQEASASTRGATCSDSCRGVVSHPSIGLSASSRVCIIPVVCSTFINVVIGIFPLSMARFAKAQTR